MIGTWFSLVIYSAMCFEDAVVVAVVVEIFFPFKLGKILQEGVDSLVHPGPLALIGVDRHREIDVADFMDDDADEAVLGPS